MNIAHDADDCKNFLQDVQFILLPLVNTLKVCKSAQNTRNETLTLGEYKEKYDHTLADMAVNFDVSISMLSQIIKGNRQPSLSLMRKIAKRTGGKVNMNSWLEN